MDNNLHIEALRTILSGYNKYPSSKVLNTVYDRICDGFRYFLFKDNVILSLTRPDRDIVTYKGEECFKYGTGIYTPIRDYIYIDNKTIRNQTIKAVLT